MPLSSLPSSNLCSRTVRSLELLRDIDFEKVLSRDPYTDSGKTVKIVSRLWESRRSAVESYHRAELLELHGGQEQVEMLGIAQL